MYQLFDNTDLYMFPDIYFCFIVILVIAGVPSPKCFFERLISSLVFTLWLLNMNLLVKYKEKMYLMTLGNIKIFTKFQACWLLR